MIFIDDRKCSFKLFLSRDVFCLGSTDYRVDRDADLNSLARAKTFQIPFAGSWNVLSIQLQ